MSESAFTVLLADPDARMRALLAEQLAPLACTVMHASDGETALRIVVNADVRLVMTELYLKTGADDCLIHAIRRSKALRKTRTLAHTKCGTSADRDWAMRAGADAYLIKPTRAERIRYVVGRLATMRPPNFSPSVTTTSATTRRNSLDVALIELEGSAPDGTSAIVFGRTWWEDLTKVQQASYRKRAKQAGVSLRSDSMLGSHFVEVRGPDRSEQSLSTERPESPYRR